MTNIEIKHMTGGWGIQNHRKVCNLFLYTSGDINVASSFWNSRRLDMGYSNKFIFSKTEFTSDPEKYLSILSSFFLSVRELRVYVTSSRDDALALVNDIYTIFNKLRKNVFIRVFYQNFTFDFPKGSIYSSRSIIATREVSSVDNSIRFSPFVPAGYENSDCVFGYDAEIEFGSGKLFSMPFSQTSAVLLSNKIEQIKYSESSASLSSSDGRQEKTQPIRPFEAGIAGLAVSNEECCIYLPESKEVVGRWIRQAGYRLEQNEHTRYAQGFIKRFGGFSKTIRLISSGGTRIFVALGSERAKQCGFKHSQIVGFLKKNFGLVEANARRIVNQYLPELLKANLIYRGYPLNCPSCGLEDWYKLDKVNEFVECTGCAENFQLESLCSLEFAFKPNELAARFLNSDGQALLEAAVFFSKLVPTGHVELGGNLMHPGKNQPFAEIDLFVLSQDILILAECKSSREIDEKKASEIIAHLDRVVETASLVNAKVVVLGVATTSVTCDLHALVATVADSAANRGIGVHLLLNNQFYQWGQAENQVTNLRQLRINDLLIKEETLPNETDVSLGEPVERYDWQEEDRLCSRDLLESWGQELSFNPSS